MVGLSDTSRIQRALAVEPDGLKSDGAGGGDVASRIRADEPQSVGGETEGTCHGGEGGERSSVAAGNILGGNDAAEKSSAVRLGVIDRGPPVGQDRLRNAELA